MKVEIKLGIQGTKARYDTHRCINVQNQYHDSDRYKRNHNGDQDYSSGSNGNQGYDHAKRAKHYASGRGSYVPNEKDLMGEVLQRERDKSAERTHLVLLPLKKV